MLERMQKYGVSKKAKARQGTVCVITCDVRYGRGDYGASSYYFGLVKLLMDAGHEVDLVDINCVFRNDATNAWIKTMHSEQGINIIQPGWPPFTANSKNSHGQIAQRPYLVYEFLKANDYDIIHLGDRCALGYYTLQARRLGLYRKPSLFCVHIDKPFLYRMMCGESLPETEADSLLCYMERRVAEMADCAIFKSTTVHAWTLEHGYNLDTTDQIINPGPTLDLPKPVQNQRIISDKATRIDHLCFVGPLNQVGGLPTFCYALNALVARGKLPRSVSFMGAVDPEFPAEEFIQDQAENWPFKWTLDEWPDRDDVMRELVRPGCLPVAPSPFEGRPHVVEECAAAGLAFVSSDIAGSEEILYPKDRKRFLTSPHHLPLADRLESLLGKFQPSPKVKHSAAYCRKTWVRFHTKLLRTIKKRTKTRTEDPLPLPAVVKRVPLVSVCMAHYNRPEMFEMSLDSLRQQTLQDFEVVIVDDGSQPQNLSKLKALARAKGARVVSQENLYLGAARNTGARNAVGKYVMFMDDDNIAKPNEIETFAKVAENADTDILVCFSDNFKGTGEFSETLLNGIRRMPIGQDMVYGMFRNMIGDSNCFMPRKLWETLGGFSEHYRVGLDDHELFIRATLLGYKVDVVPEALFYYRLGIPKMKRFHVAKRANFQRIVTPYMQSGILPPELEAMPFVMRALYEKNNKG